MNFSYGGPTGPKSDGLGDDPVPLPEVITASQFKEGDQVRFAHAERHGVLYFVVAHIDSKHAFLKALGDQVINYRASLRSSELRVFDRIGWTLLPGHFDRHTPTDKAL